MPEPHPQPGGRLGLARKTAVGTEAAWPAWNAPWAMPPFGLHSWGSPLQTPPVHPQPQSTPPRPPPRPVAPPRGRTARDFLDAPRGLLHAPASSAAPSTHGDVERAGVKQRPPPPHGTSTAGLHELARGSRRFHERGGRPPPLLHIAARLPVVVIPAPDLQAAVRPFSCRARRDRRGSGLSRAGPTPSRCLPRSALASQVRGRRLRWCGQIWRLPPLPFPLSAGC